MKKLLTIICVAGLFACNVNNAQAQETKFGIKGGATLYSVTTELGDFGEETTDGKVGFAAGLYMEKPFSDLISLQIEGLFVQKGGEDEDDFFGDESVTLSYVDVPVLIRFNVPLAENVQPYVYGGGYLGYLLDASSNEEDISEFLEDINYGAAFGAGVSFGMLSLDIRYDLGLANIYDDSELGDLGGFEDFFDGANIEASTSGLMLTAGISF